jgi:hypothetical protein
MFPLSLQSNQSKFSTSLLASLAGDKVALNLNHKTEIKQRQMVKRPEMIKRSYSTNDS